jgi:hypothetical protein
MTELQYYSPGRQIYYWFGYAFGLTGKHEGSRDILLHLGTEAQVKEALANGKRSVHKQKNKILDRERALVKKLKGKKP